MAIDFTLINYRCFSDDSPATITIEDGFTAIVGVNNAGKSALLRSVIELESYFELLSDDRAFELAMKEQAHLRPPQIGNQITDTQELFCDRNNRPLQIDIKLTGDDADGAENEAVSVTATVSRDMRCRHVFRLRDGTLIDGPIQKSGSAFRESSSMLLGSVEAIRRAAWKLRNAKYLPATRNIVNQGSAALYGTLIGTAFVKHWHVLKTGNDKGKRDQAALLTETIRRLLGFASLELNASFDQSTLLLTIDGRTRRLEEVGTGSAQLIVSLVNAAIQSPSLILIDEPETNLHPSLQIEFLQSLHRCARNGVIFATHNIGLARAIAENIYALVPYEKEGQRSVRLSRFSAVPRLSEFLGSLSYSSYAAIGFEKVLLVEGRTDVLMFHEWLRKLGHDHRILVVPLGGGEMINGSCEAELHELKRICSSIGAVVDSDRAGQAQPPAPNPAAFADVCRRVGIKCHLTELRSTDHYLSDCVINAEFGDGHCALPPFAKAQPSWGKHRNWQAASRMRRDDLVQTDIGRFLEEFCTQPLNS